jgi:hypothetical protein
MTRAIGFPEKGPPFLIFREGVAVGETAEDARVAARDRRHASQTADVSRSTAD